MNNTFSKIDSTASEILEAFFAILPSRISEDFRSLRQKRNTLREQERTFRKNPSVRLPDIVESYHRRLLLSVEMSRGSKLPGDLLLFSATLTAHELAELSCSASTGRGGLKEYVEMEGILKEPGELARYSAKIASSDRLFDQIHDVVFLNVLERYGMDEYARLFENRRPLYEIRCEVGRRLISPGLVGEDEHLETLARFRKRFGSKTEQEFLRRLRRHSLLIF